MQSQQEGTIILKAGREKPVRNRHPWIFSRAIERAQGAVDGETVRVLSHQGDFLARGYWNHHSQIQVRFLTWQDEVIDDTWWTNTLRRAVQSRRARLKLGSAFRLVNAENDYAPGLIVDRYGDFLVLQALTLYIDRHKNALTEILVKLCQEMGIAVRGVYERSDVDVRQREGLREVKGLLWGEAPPERMTFEYAGVVHFVDVYRGQKTGYYLDQLENHALIWNLCQQHDLRQGRLLNAFSYAGGFGLGCGCHVVNVDSSAEALTIAQQSYQQAGVQPELMQTVEADVFRYLRDCATRGELFDVVVLDPPKFAHSQQQVERATRGYKDINLHAFRITKPGGFLATFSCSGAISSDLFQKIVFGALADSGRQAQIVRHLGPGEDHPVALEFPEGAYLKGLLLHVY